MANLLINSEKAKVEEFYKKIKNECSDILEHYRKTKISKDNISNVLLRRTAITKTFTIYDNRLREIVKGSIDRLYLYTHYALPYMKGAIDRRYTYYMAYGNLNGDMSETFGSNIYVLFPQDNTQFNMLKEDFNAPYNIVDEIKKVFVDIVNMLQKNYSIRVYSYDIPMLFIGMPSAYDKMLQKIKHSDSDEQAKISKVRDKIYDIMKTFGYDIKSDDFEFMDTYLFLERNCNDLRDIEKAADIIDSVYVHINEIFFDLLDDFKNSTNPTIRDIVDTVLPLKQQITDANKLLHQNVLKYFKKNITVRNTKNLPVDVVMDEVYAQGKSYAINYNSKEFEYLLELINND